MQQPSPGNNRTEHQTIITVNQPNGSRSRHAQLPDCKTRNQTLQAAQNENKNTKKNKHALTDLLARNASTFRAKTSAAYPTLSIHLRRAARKRRAAVTCHRHDMEDPRDTGVGYDCPDDGLLIRVSLCCPNFRGWTSDLKWIERLRLRVSGETNPTRQQSWRLFEAWALRSCVNKRYNSKDAVAKKSPNPGSGEPARRALKKDERFRVCLAG